MRTIAESDIHRRLPATLVFATLAIATTLLVAPPTGAGDIADTRAPQGAAAATSAPRPGMRVYRDPATGAFTAPPAGTALPPATRALGTAAENLVETPGTSAGGGVTIDLRGSFQSAITATVDDEGHVGTDCRSAADAPR